MCFEQERIAIELPECLLSETSVIHSNLTHYPRRATVAGDAITALGSWAAVRCSLGGRFAVHRHVPMRNPVGFLWRMARRAVKEVECLGYQSIGSLWPVRQPFLVLKMGELF